MKPGKYSTQKFFRTVVPKGWRVLQVGQKAVPFYVPGGEPRSWREWMQFAASAAEAQLVIEDEKARVLFIKAPPFKVEAQAKGEGA